MVSEVPPQVLGTVQDAWFREGIDMGMPVPPLGGGYEPYMSEPGRNKPVLRSLLYWTEP